MGNRSIAEGQYVNDKCPYRREQSRLQEDKWQAGCQRDNNGRGDDGTSRDCPYRERVPSESGITRILVRRRRKIMPAHIPIRNS